MINRNGPYVVLKGSRIEPKAVAGTVVFRPTGWDYGLASDDTRMTGIEHISVTLNTFAWPEPMKLRPPPSPQPNSRLRSINSAMCR